MKKQIIAMGGGGFSTEPDSSLLDQYILDQARRSKPRICFLGTASGDAENYLLRFYTSFLKLKCNPTHLSLFKLPTNDLESFILDADVIYVGGGNTRSLLALWKEWKLDVYLRTAWENGIVLAGISAGSICWFEEGVSDYYPNELNTLECLGFLRGSNCPHYDKEAMRRPSYQQLVWNGSISEGIAAEDGVALHYIGTELESVVSSRPGAKAYYVRRKSNQIEEVPIATNYLGQ
jgi:dipeptidase E